MPDFLNKIKQKLCTDKQIVIHCKINAGSAQNKITEIMDNDVIKIAISAPPEKGKANAELIKFLSTEFNVPKSNIEIISGGVTKNKLIKISL
jgi:uncharacterized protein (TIGR00251 family)